MLDIIERVSDYPKSICLEKEKVDSIVENVLRTIKEELPEEAQTVEVLDYITDRIKEALKE